MQDLHVELRKLLQPVSHAADSLCVKTAWAIQEYWDQCEPWIVVQFLRRGPFFKKV